MGGFVVFLTHFLRHMFSVCGIIRPPPQQRPSSRRESGSSVDSQRGTNGLPPYLAWLAIDGGAKSKLSGGEAEAYPAPIN